MVAVEEREIETRDGGYWVEEDAGMMADGGGGLVADGNRLTSGDGGEERSSGVVAGVKPDTVRSDDNLQPIPVRSDDLMDSTTICSWFR